MKKFKENYIHKLQKKANKLRNLTLDMCVSAGSGGIASCFSCAEILSVLYGEIMNYDSENPKWEQRDRFIIGKGHASPILCATLSDAGFFPEEWLYTLCKKNGKFGLHLQKDVPGVETSSGSIGHGIGIGAGMALAAKMDNKKYKTFVLISDGALYEGSSWEAIRFASHHNLNNLITIVDRNKLCAYNFTEDCVRLEPIDKTFDIYGWDVKRINGHSIEELLNAFKDIKSETKNKPHVIIADTIKGKGSPYIENQVVWHTKFPNKQEIKKIKKEINLK